MARTFSVEHQRAAARARRYEPEAVRFWGKVAKSEGCWLWQGYVQPNGYGQFLGTRVDGRVPHRYVHRFAYEALRGPIPEGLEIDHLCRVRHCVNPDHLEPVTHAENVRRSDSPRATRQRHAEGRMR